MHGIPKSGYTLHPKNVHKDVCLRANTHVNARWQYEHMCTAQDKQVSLHVCPHVHNNKVGKLYISSACLCV